MRGVLGRIAVEALAAAVATVASELAARWAQHVAEKRWPSNEDDVTRIAVELRVEDIIPSEGE